MTDSRSPFAEMAEKELAEKLARRLQAIGNPEGDDESTSFFPPPPVPPSPPKENFVNPYVANDEGFSIDALVCDIIERNNNLAAKQSAATSLPLTPPPSHSPASSASPPPLQQAEGIRSRIAQLVQPPLPSSPAPPAPIELPREEDKRVFDEVSSSLPLVSKRPEVRIQKQTRPSTPTQHASPTDDGSELARRLEQQRQKKTPIEGPLSHDPILQEIERLERATPPRIPAPPPILPQGKAIPPPPPFKPPPPPGEHALPRPVLAAFSMPETASPPPERAGHRLAPPSSPPPLPPPLSASDMLGAHLRVTSPPSASLPSRPSPTSSSDESEELAAKLARRNLILEGELSPEMIGSRKMGLAHEFPEFSRKQLKHFADTFKKYDEDGDNFIDFMELKRMMEKLGEPQTHVTLKQIIKKVDEDEDGKVSLREFLLIFRHAASGELGLSSEVFCNLADSVDVSTEGVQGAAQFFQAKIAEQTKASRFEEEIKEEQAERKAAEDEKKKRRELFLANRNVFH